jgi:hypothetical protein
LQVFFPAHLDLAVWIAFKNSWAADGVNRDAPAAGYKPDDVFSGQRMAAQGKPN